VIALHQEKKRKRRRREGNEKRKINPVDIFRWKIKKPNGPGSRG